MGGLVIDIYVAFAIKGLIRLFGMIRTTSWRRLQAKVLRSSRDSDWCPIVTVSYEFNGSAGVETGETVIPFLFTQTADRYARALATGRSITIRVAKDDSYETVFFPRDSF
jgi:hypothetical protein